MDITKSQSDFEAWFKSEFIVPASSLTLSPETFKNAVQKAYQAGRESIEVELPMRLSPCRSGYGYTLIPNDIGEALEYDNVVEKLHAQGIRIKGESE
ncbi:hypothetical protein [Yersinia frederiksenii]|uniref:hypothetical protein n=1 Tax=Yersinia frederiksenii TaxID=29484 RepID=UPI0005E69B88|nr:hypothetical protein [Yersinia frederiksenii]CNL09710.1 Uncharacterised protein [Yersinia frederiksenii]